MTRNQKTQAEDKTPNQVNMMEKKTRAIKNKNVIIDEDDDFIDHQNKVTEHLNNNRVSKKKDSAPKSNSENNKTKKQ
jgi:hypothetical protein